jgi:hypothetical protein
LDDVIHLWMRGSIRRRWRDTRVGGRGKGERRRKKGGEVAS